METSRVIRYLEAYSRDASTGIPDISNVGDIKGEALG
jgi:hypothetical protein